MEGDWEPFRNRRHANNGPQFLVLPKGRALFYVLLKMAIVSDNGPLVLWS